MDGDPKCATRQTGRFTVPLGSATTKGLPTNLFASGEARWLGIQGKGRKSSLVCCCRALRAESCGCRDPGWTTAVGVCVGSAGRRNTTSASSAPLLRSHAPRPSAVQEPRTMFRCGPTARGPGQFDLVSVGYGSAPRSASTRRLRCLHPQRTQELVRGLFEMATTNYASPTKGYNSQPFNIESSAYNSGTAKYTLNHFQWQAEPTGNNTTSPGATLNLLYGTDPAAPSETGLKLSSTGLFTFASGQVFPGTGTITGVTAGTDLTGGGTSGTVTLSLLTSCASGQILQWNGTLWVCSNAGSGTITQVKAGTDLTGGGNSGSVTLNLEYHQGAATEHCQQLHRESDVQRKRQANDCG